MIWWSDFEKNYIQNSEIIEKCYLYVKEHQRYNFFKLFFPIIPMGAIRYSCPIRLVPNYILPAKERRLLGKFHPDNFKTERLVCVETVGQTDMARSTCLVMLIKNIYT